MQLNVDNFYNFLIKFYCCIACSLLRAVFALMAYACAGCLLLWTEYQRVSRDIDDNIVAAADSNNNNNHNNNNVWQ